MVIKILGTDCPKCKMLEESAKKAVAESGIEAEVVKVTELNDIMNYGVMATPALVIDEEVKSAGKVLSPQEVSSFLNSLRERNDS